MATRKQVLAPLGTFVVVAAVGATFALVSTGPSSHAPHKLALSSGSFAKDAAPVASGATASGGGDYRLTGTLPAGTPADAAAWELSSGSPSASTVDRLKAALHTTTLYVGKTGGLPWSYSPCGGGPDTAVSSDGATTGCAVSAPGSSTSSGSGSSPGSPGVTDPATGGGPAIDVAPVAPITAGPPQGVPSPPPPIAAATVTKAADPVFAALGLDPSTAVVDTSPYGGTATISPKVDGLETVGYSTSVYVDQAGTVQSANGWLGDPHKADAYPLITAKAAFDALPTAPRLDTCQIPTDGSSGCVEPAPQEVTGAHLGLLLQPTVDDGQVLVPAWLFDLKGATQPMAQVAVETEYLAPPVEPTNPTTNASDEPVPPPSAVEPVAARAAVKIMGAHKGKTASSVIVEYGDNGCPHSGVQHDVKEDATSVYVVLTADAPAADVACTQIYTARQVTVELQSPLAQRKVIDANGDIPVPVT